MEHKYWQKHTDTTMHTTESDRVHRAVLYNLILLKTFDQRKPYQRFSLPCQDKIIDN